LHTVGKEAEMIDVHHFLVGICFTNARLTTAHEVLASKDSDPPISQIRQVDL